MASLGSSVYILVVALATVWCFCDAKDLNVGGKDGWVLHPSESYSSWSSRLRFNVNDNLHFKYDGSKDSVLVVKKEDYDSCNTKSPIATLTGGDSVYNLNRPGPFYFISGNKANCDQVHRVEEERVEASHLLPLVVQVHQVEEERVEAPRLPLVAQVHLVEEEEGVEASHLLPPVVQVHQVEAPRLPLVAQVHQVEAPHPPVVVQVHQAEEVEAPHLLVVVRRLHLVEEGAEAPHLLLVVRLVHRVVALFLLVVVQQLHQVVRVPLLQVGLSHLVEASHLLQPVIQRIHQVERHLPPLVILQMLGGGGELGEIQEQQDSQSA